MIREATLVDAKKIQQLIHAWADDGAMLHRPINNIYENIRNIHLYEKNGEVVGTASLDIVWEDIAEIRSLAVAKNHTGEGIGKALIEKSIEVAIRLGVKSVFVLTYVPDYFVKLGFSELDKAKLPHKIWSDCVNCHKFPDCDETAVMKVIS